MPATQPATAPPVGPENVDWNKIYADPRFATSSKEAQFQFLSEYNPAFGNASQEAKDAYYNRFILPIVNSASKELQPTKIDPYGEGSPVEEFQAAISENVPVEAVKGMMGDYETPMGPEYETGRVPLTWKNIKTGAKLSAENLAHIAYAQYKAQVDEL